MIALDIIQSKVKEGVTHGSKGRHCCFVKITDTIGAKLYGSESQRDNCYENQSNAAEYDLGPDVYGTFEFVSKESIKARDNEIIKVGDNVYGYLTELVEVGVDPAEDWDDDDEWREREDWFNKNYEDDGQVQELRDKLREIGFDFNDYTNFNVGIKNGRLICIDFGR